MSLYLHRFGSLLSLYVLPPDKADLHVVPVRVANPLHEARIGDVWHVSFDRKDLPLACAQLPVDALLACDSAQITREAHIVG